MSSKRKLPNLAVNNFVERLFVCPKRKIGASRQERIAEKEANKKASEKLVGTGYKLETYFPMNKDIDAAATAAAVQKITGIKMVVVRSMI